MRAKITKSTAPVIEPSNPWVNDPFERQVHGERLTMLVQRTPSSFVIAIKAPFGSGKSVFLNRWEAHLQKVAKIPVVKLDAWKFDYLSDPLEALVIALASRLEKVEGLPKIKRRISTTISGLTKSVAEILPKVLRGAVAVNTLGVSEVVIAAADTVSFASEKLLPDAKAREKSVKEFAKSISDAKADLTADLQPGTSDVPLVFILDELDRCRPDFAIKMLERIKHLFDVPGIIFAIAMDGENLPAAVQCLYGQSVNGERYLRKFFDLEFYLPEPTIKQVIAQFFVENGLIQAPAGTNVAQAIQKANEDWPTKLSDGTVQFESLDVPKFALAFETFAPVFQLSLRDMVQALTALVAVIRSVKETEAMFPVPLTLALCLRFREPELFQKILAGRKTLDGIYASNTRDNLEVESLESMTQEGSAVRIVLQHFVQISNGDKQEANRRLRSATGIDWNTSSSHERLRCTLAKYLLDDQRFSSTTPNDQLRKLLNIAGTFVTPSDVNNRG